MADDTREIIWRAAGSDTPAAQPLAAGTYYASLNSGRGRDHCHQFDWNNVLAAVVTFEGALKGTARPSATSARDWSPVTGLGTVNIVAGAEGSEIVPSIDDGEMELRAKAVVTVQGELLGRTR